MAYMNNIGQTNNQLQQSYTQVLASVNLLGTFERDIISLAPFTDNTKRIPGTILAKLTSGVDDGKYVNYKDGAANGQGTAKAILIDQYLNPNDNISPTYAEILRIGKVYAYALLVTAGSTLNTALNQLRAVEYYDGARQLCYDIRGPVVS